MADEIDIASEVEMLQRDAFIAKARNQSKKITTGFCDYCNERLDSMAKRFCSPECRDDYEMEEAAMKRHNGRC